MSFRSTRTEVARRGTSFRATRTDVARRGTSLRSTRTDVARRGISVRATPRDVIAARTDVPRRATSGRGTLLPARAAFAACRLTDPAPRATRGALSATAAQERCAVFIPKVSTSLAVSCLCPAWASPCLRKGALGSTLRAPFPDTSPFWRRIGPAVRRREGWRSSMAEHLFCKQVVRGSSPLVSSSFESRKRKDPEGCPSGQREQTVNLPAMPSMVRIHHPPRRTEETPRGSSSVGRASAFQAERRRFESGLPLVVNPDRENEEDRTQTAHLAQR